MKIYDKVERINISELPEKFVLKTNHGSGFNIIVDDKSKLDVESAKMNISKWLNIDYGKNAAEFHYSFIISCNIIIDIYKNINKIIINNINELKK